jgi:hypothetical protein
VGQLGFGWGRGRRVIKTTIAGATLTRALEKQQRWVDRLTDPTVRLKPEAEKLRMAKARVRSALR